VNDRLLEIISTRGDMSLVDFDLAYDRIVPQTDGQNLRFMRRNALSSLEALGHCETDWYRQRVFACPPVLARLPNAGCPRVVLTGARAEQTVNDLRSYAKGHPDAVDFSIATQTQGLPDVVTVEAANEITLADCASACRVPLAGQLPASWALANVSGSIAEYEASLSWKPDAPLNWRMGIFDPSVLVFRRADDPLAESLRSVPAYLTEHTHPVTQQRYCRWTKDDEYSLVLKDWGRWLALFTVNRRIISYDSRRQRLAVPSSVPLPRLLARAATLCSGRAPHIEIDHNLRVYDSVPVNLAELIAGKCGQFCKSVNLERISDRA